MSRRWALLGIVLAVIVAVGLTVATVTVPGLLQPPQRGSSRPVRCGELCGLHPAGRSGVLLLTWVQRRP